LRRSRRVLCEIRLSSPSSRVVVFALDVRACIFFDVSDDPREGEKRRTTRETFCADESGRRHRMRGSLVRALRTKVSIARACVESVPISSSSRLSSSPLSQTARRHSSPIERRLSFCRIRIRRAGSFASSVHAPSARLHARVRALGRGVRDHSSLSRGHRRRGHEPLCSRSRCVVREVTHSFIHSFIHIHSFTHVARLVDRARATLFRGRVTPPLASRHLDERVDKGARDSSRRAAKTNRERARKMRVRGAACFV